MAFQVRKSFAEWSAPGREPVGPRARLLPASNLVMTEHRTIVCGDAATEPAFDEAGRALLAELGSGSVLAVPLSMRGETLGALALHRAEAGRWSAGHVALAEAVAHEAAVAVRAADLLAENRRRLEEFKYYDPSYFATLEVQLGEEMSRLGYPRRFAA